MSEKAPAYRSPPRPSALLRAARRVVFWGRRRYCPVCQSHVRGFQLAGHIRRLDACCPVCGSVERHRLTWMFFQKRTPLLQPGELRMLHVAPEPEFERKLRRLPGLRYETLDTQDVAADHRVDLAATGFPDETYDAIHCSHVLEHVADDRACMAEMFRVLKRGGWATILVPMIAEKSHEDPSITDPKERARLYGQWDHVRAYGPDFVDRLRDAGFTVETVTALQMAGSEEARTQLGLADEQLFFCTKNA